MDEAIDTSPESAMAYLVQGGRQNRLMSAFRTYMPRDGASTPRGNRSGKALEIMQQLGYTNAVNVGGMGDARERFE